MNELNISSYIRIMQPGFKTHDKQEAAGVFLLSSINDQEYVSNNGYWTSNLSSKKISRLVSQDDPVPDGLRQASMEQTVIDATVAYFKKEVMPDLNPHLKDDTIDKMVKLISIDTTIPESKKKSLMAFHETGDDATFLAEVFLYVLNRPNKKQSNTVEYQDAPLLAEANYECPLCHKKLVDSIKGQAVKKYRITQVFPAGLKEETAAEFAAVYPIPLKLDAPDNLIALDEDCAERYLLSPTAEEYGKLHEIKTQLTKNYAAKLSVNDVQLEDDIRTILSALGTIKNASELVELEYEALRIDEKFDAENFILKNETQMQVVTYYRYIEKVFSNSNADFDMIASEIKVSSMKLEKAGLSQQDVISQLSEWIRNKAGLGTESLLACNIVVSFFIQNCEVFHK